ncbi:MAG: hypothetical protein ACRDRJ_46720, partial [Streptosporangiaceae bacterium]
PMERRRSLGRRLARFSGAAVAALAATEVVLTICNGVCHLTATPAALLSWFAGAVVSYALSRWAWNRTGRPDVLRETIPFWAISVAVVVLLTLANKLGYRSAAWLHLTGAGHVLWVDLVWLVANFGTFLLRFAIFHRVLFTDRTEAPRPQADAEGTPPQGTHHAPRHAAAQPARTAPRHAA